MSHTDKTRPLWVQFRDPLNWRYMEEVHHHNDGVCDFDEFMASSKDFIPLSWRNHHCFLYHSFYGGWHGEFWPRQPRRGSRVNQHRRIRGKWREERNRLMKDPDFDYSKPRAREYNSWMWEKWNW